MRKQISPSYSYIENQLPNESQKQQRARQRSQELGLDQISISKTEAHLIQFLIKLVKPKKIVEIGTLTGLSALYFLESLESSNSLGSKSKLWTFEKSIEHVEKAKESLNTYIATGRCEIMLGDALVELPKIEKHGPFEAIFIDGNKAAYYNYWKWAELNIAKGGLIIIDNVFLAGAVWGDQTKQKFSEKQIFSVKKMTREIIENSQFRSTFVPTDEGLLLAYKE